MRVKVRKKPAPAVVCGKRANIVPEVSVENIRQMATKLHYLFAQNKTLELFDYTKDCMLSDFVSRVISR